MPREALITVRKEVPADALGMWDLPDAALKGDRVVARGCDDLAGVAAMLTMLQRLSKKRVKADVYCLFTRAEETGFVGATGAIQARTLPRRVPVISIETSSALVHAKIGDGPIIRIGDRMCVYTPAFADFACRVAQGLAKRRKRFIFQRKLMDGGMCEAAAFGVHGYQVLGICLALGNYHNMDTQRKKIASEWVSLRDWHGMVDLFEALVLDDRGPGTPDNALRQLIEKIFKEGEPLLRE
jgi:endoglucanase